MEGSAACIKPVEHEEVEAAEGHDIGFSSLSEPYGHEDDALGSLAQLLDEEKAREPLAKMRGFGSPCEGDDCVWVEVEQDSRDYLGGRVWRASYALLRFLEQEYTSLQGLRILELGAGTGILGIALAKASPPPAKVVVTDLPALLPLLQSNIHRNGVGSVCEALPLDWTQQEDDSTGRGTGTRIGPMLREVLAANVGGGGWFDVVLASDCIYYAHLYGPLLATATPALNTGARLILANDDSRTSTGTHSHSPDSERWDSSFFALLGQHMSVRRQVLEGGPSASDGMTKTGGPFHLAIATLTTTHKQPHPHDTTDEGCGP